MKEMDTNISDIQRNYAGQSLPDANERYPCSCSLHYVQDAEVEGLRSEKGCEQCPCSLNFTTRNIVNSKHIHALMFRNTIRTQEIAN